MSKSMKSFAHYAKPTIPALAEYRPFIENIIKAGDEALDKQEYFNARKLYELAKHYITFHDIPSHTVYTSTTTTTSTGETVTTNSPSTYSISNTLSQKLAHDNIKSATSMDAHKNSLEDSDIIKKFKNEAKNISSKLIKETSNISLDLVNEYHNNILTAYKTALVLDPEAKEAIDIYLDFCFNYSSNNAKLVLDLNPTVLDAHTKYIEYGLATKTPKHYITPELVEATISLQTKQAPENLDKFKSDLAKSVSDNKNSLELLEILATKIPSYYELNKLYADKLYAKVTKSSASLVQDWIKTTITQIEHLQTIKPSNDNTMKLLTLNIMLTVKDDKKIIELAKSEGVVLDNQSNETLADAYFRTKDYQKALDIYKTLPNTSYSFTVLANKMAAFEKLGQHTEAEKIAKMFKEQSSDTNLHALSDIIIGNKTAMDAVTTQFSDALNALKSSVTSDNNNDVHELSIIGVDTDLTDSH